MTIARQPAAAPLLLLTSLYIAQGLPYGFFTQALPVLMREHGASLKAISATSLLFLPWALKFLWAPMVDQIGTRRGWILPIQLIAAMAAAALALIDPAQGFTAVFVAVFAFNALAAIQDVATDGLAVRLLDAQARGLGNGIQVGAYRIGMVLGGGLLLWVYARFGWVPMCLGMSALLAFTCLPVLLHRAAQEDASLRKVRPPIAKLAAGWWPRLRLPGMSLLLALVCAYKFGDAMTASLVGPMLKDAQWPTAEIAVVKGTLGSIMGMVGAAAGGWLAFRLGRRRALLGCGIAQALSLLLYVAAAGMPADRALVWTACIAEHLFGGMATVALFTLMMDAADPEHAGTDYTLLACAVVVAQGLAAFAAAAIGDAHGYVPAFAVGFVAAMIGCALLVVALDRGRGPARLEAVWQKP
ncbi:MFS transporter [Nevskia sp.]|uniref:MFS transporter n=1 Tax=Nevskia sp. TaxID=1929292 RepID=UPI0025FBE9ED|nr:MFS transporter [Nevskia sp.]